MQDNQYPLQPLPTFTQLFVVAFMRATVTEFAKYAATEMIREWVEPPRRKRRYKRNGA